MKERRKRLVKYGYKKEGRLSEFEHGYKTLMTKKATIIKKFDNIKLEQLLKASAKNATQEIVSCLVDMEKC